MSTSGPNDPFMIESDGTYITMTQIKFFLNRSFGKEKINCRHRDFVKYYNMCRIYNLVSEIYETDHKSAMLYWDSVKGQVSIGFPVKGKVATAIQNLRLAGDDDYDEDTWSI